jgi:hypothetical protein
MFVTRLIKICTLAIALSAPAIAATAEEVLLVVDVKGDGSDLRSLTDADLLALPQVEFTTSTIWTTDPITFAGPTLAAVLESVGAADGALSMVAVNDYKVQMPREIVAQDAPIIANRMNGEPFTIRNKGPLWLVFPFDSSTAYQTEEIYSYSIWQLTRIAVVPD